MPGRIRTSFRSGNLSEHLGLLLLKGIAAVADVARPEDIGLDAIATLLRRDKDGNCYAEDSFLVQLKVASMTSIQYKGHELEWFVSQTQPLFIGLVSLAASQISLYPTLFVNHAVLSLHAKRVTIRFGASELPPFFRGQKWGAWAGEADDGATVWLGAPLLRWTLSDLVDNEWPARTYETLKRFIAVARRELELLSFGQCSVLDWSTNDTQTITSQSGMMKGHHDDLASLAGRCAPCLHAIMLQAFSMPADSGNSLTLSLLKLAAALRDSGVEIDPENLFGKFFFALQKQPDKDDGTPAT
jgi:hypothetical protein